MQQTQWYIHSWNKSKKWAKFLILNWFHQGKLKERIKSLFDHCGILYIYGCSHLFRWSHMEGELLAVFTQLCTAREITSRESVNARVRVHTINIGTKKLEFYQLMTSAQEWVPKVSCDLKLHAEWKSEVNVNKQTRWVDFNTGWCEMRNSVRLLVLFLAAQYMLDSSDDLLDLLAAPLFFGHTNRHRMNGKKAERDGEQEIRFLRYRRTIELLSCTTMQYMYWKRMECQLTGTRSNQLLEFSEMVQFRRRHCSSFLKRPWIIVQNPKKS